MSDNQPHNGHDGDTKPGHVDSHQTTRLNVTQASQSADDERVSFAGFVRHAEPWHRAILCELNAIFWQLNQALFQTELKQPHLMIGMTAPRVLGFCKNITDYGGRLQITFRPSLFDGSHRLTTENWFESVGVKRFVNDILLHELVHQYHFEITGKTEPKMGGHGKHFAGTCNCITRDHFIDVDEWVDDGAANVITPNGTFGPRVTGDRAKKQHWRVHTRRRGPEDGHKRLAKYWPHCIRPEGFYGSGISYASGSTFGPKPRHVPAWAMVLENIVAYYEAGRMHEFVVQVKEELKKLTRADCSDCGRVWDSMWDEPVCQLDQLKPQGLPNHWLGNVPWPFRPMPDDEF